MGADWVARGTAFGSAAVALASLGWNVFSWQRNGPVVKVRATCSGRGQDMRITGRISNTGRADALVDSATFKWMSGGGGDGTGRVRTLTCALPPAHIEGITLPDFPLPAGSGHEFVVNDINGVDLGLSVALHDRRQVKLIFRTASGRKATKTIKYGK